MPRTPPLLLLPVDSKADRKLNSECPWEKFVHIFLLILFLSLQHRQSYQYLDNTGQQWKSNVRARHHYHIIMFFWKCSDKVSTSHCISTVRQCLLHISDDHVDHIFHLGWKKYAQNLLISSLGCTRLPQAAPAESRHQQLLLLSRPWVLGWCQNKAQPWCWAQAVCVCVCVCVCACARASAGVDS